LQGRARFLFLGLRVIVCFERPITSYLLLKRFGNRNLPNFFHSFGPVRHYQGLDMRNFQTARPVTPSVSTYDVPIYRQLASIPNPDQARLIRSLNLCRESHRFQTFTADWPSDSAPPAEDMAASGWFYLGNLDRTQCFCCGGVLRNWRRLDNPNTEHLAHFPHCTMAQGLESRNIPDADRQVTCFFEVLFSTC